MWVGCNNYMKDVMLGLVALKQPILPTKYLYCFIQNQLRQSADDVPL